MEGVNPWSVLKTQVPAGHAMYTLPKRKSEMSLGTPEAVCYQQEQLEVLVFQSSLIFQLPSIASHHQCNFSRYNLECIHTYSHHVQCLCKFLCFDKGKPLHPSLSVNIKNDMAHLERRIFCLSDYFENSSFPKSADLSCLLPISHTVTFPKPKPKPQ
ncbi:hypothetical protein M514_20212 [Trichuris suis]|uniref:Uncharacterized protein n=1 Tax=Trichuris suis TaxID=68888 RepID=A0A085NDI9_9BILA|nr:hypothetical protein M514_20212 [Trichuris suis]